MVHNAETWADAAKSARNYLAHTGTAGEDLKQLHAVAEVTAGVVILNLLHELGVPQDRLLKAVSEHPVLSQAATLARRVLCDNHSVVTRIAAITTTVSGDSPASAAGARDSHQTDDDDNGVNATEDPAPG